MLIYTLLFKNQVIFLLGFNYITEKLYYRKKIICLRIQLIKSILFFQYIKKNFTFLIK